jgi:hypothetical protein
VRTTLTLDDDLVAALKQTTQGSGLSFEEVVNRTLRSGLAAEATPPKARPYRVKPASLGVPMPGLDLDKALRLADALEDEAIGRSLDLSQ